MNLKQLEYIVAIAETGNLSLAAEKMYITQSALSQQLAKLKQEGVPPLFREEKKKMVLTDAGKIYLNGARAILREEALAQKKLNSLNDEDKVVFDFTVAPYLQSVVYINILPKLKKQFPKVSVRVHTNNTMNTREALENGSIDMAFIPDIYQQRDFFDYIHIFKDELVMISPGGNDQTADISTDSNMEFSGAVIKTEADEHSSASDKLPVIIPTEDSYLREILDRIFSEENNIPEIYTETNDFNISLSLVKNGECKAVIPRSLVNEDGLRIESFRDPCYFYLTAIHKKTTASPIIDAAVKELKRYFIA
ncbi:LysR family transcriptional regulator [Oribacterium sp. FC2011]|uniref:LysR family transcriptional regulator n=1 Tax=Oribacterium sp. FC2011 TaxID=1408311 RepID=UPI0004E2093B|nr:LysR family transcriptional regulator [Oribacterium sp. FC2011]